MAREILQYTSDKRNGLFESSGSTRKVFAATIICGSPILGMGIKNIFSDSLFSASLVSNYSDVPSAAPSHPEACLFIVDWFGGQPNAIACIKTIRELHPEAKVAVVADQFGFEAIKLGLDLGVVGFCLTSSSPDVLIKSLELVMLQELVLPSTVMRLALETCSGISQTESQESVAETKAPDPKARKLSNREAEILGCLMQGSSNKHIARKLDVTEATVKVHVKAILRKIGATNRTQAAIWATDHLPAQAGSRISM